MAQDNSILGQISQAWKFLGFFQSPFLRILHVTIVALIFLQLISVLTMEPLMSTYYTSGDEITFSNMYHYIGGIVILLLTFLMLYVCILNKGFKNYFPYLYLDFSTLTKDFLSILKKVPGPAPKGITSCIQGIGLIIFLLAALSGFIWFILYMFDCDLVVSSLDVIEYHYLLVTPIYLYILIHGILSILHFINWKKKVKSK